MSTGVQERGGMKAAGAGGTQQAAAVRTAGQQQQQQEFDSWRHQTHQPHQQGFNPMSSMASDPYLSSFYAGSYHYPGFGVGDGTWSNGGDHMTFLGNYGAQMAPTADQAGYSDMSQAPMFGAGGGFGTFTQPAATGYGFDYHTGSGYSQWGSRSAAGDAYYRADPYGQPEQDRSAAAAAVAAAVQGGGRVTAAEQAMQGLSIAGGGQQLDGKEGGGGGGKMVHQHEGGKEHHHHHHQQVKLSSIETNGTAGGGGGGGGGGKKMSWASIASQPAKPVPAPNKNKKPGVLPPPVTVMPSGKHNMDIGTWVDAKQNGAASPSAAGPPPPPPMVAAKSGGGGGAGRGWAGVAGPRGSRQGPPGPGGPAYPNLAAGQMMQGGGGGGNNGGLPPMQASPSHPVLEELKSANEYNPRDFDLSPKNARFFVIKSYSEDDVHRSIKYEIWCSTDHGNKRLDSAFRESQGPVYLFFSVNGSGHFCGMAQMLNGVDYNSSAGVWAQDKWKGQFKVKWIYVKDVPNSQLRHIRLENNENKPVTNSRDTQEVPVEKGRQVLKILHSYKNSTSIFDDFFHYEKRQEEDEGRKQPQNNGRDRDRDSRPDRPERSDNRGEGRGRGNSKK